MSLPWLRRRSILGSSEVRLPNVGVPHEIKPLVSSINNALDRLDDGLRRQQDFNANAAHQLRTPLAVLSANVDMMDDKIIAAKLRYDIDLMSRIVTQLLLVARLETLNIRLDEEVELVPLCERLQKTSDRSQFQHRKHSKSMNLQSQFSLVEMGLS